MRISGSLYNIIKPIMSNQKTINNRSTNKKYPRSFRPKYAMLFLTPLLFATSPIKAQDKPNQEQYVNIQMGEKDNSRKDFNYFYNKKYANTDSIIYANGKIENFKQGNSPDCTLLSAIKSTSLTPEGKKIIQSMITPQSDGSFQIELSTNTDSSTYTVTRKDFFAQENKNLSTLDDDVKLIEIGVKKYCQDNNKDFKMSPTEALRLLTGASPDYSISTEDEDKAFIEIVEDKKVVSSNISEVYELLDHIFNLDNEKRKNSLLICSTKDKDVKYGLYGNHSYYVTWMKLKKNEAEEFDGIFELKNPHSTEAKPVKLNLQQLLESLKGFDYLEFDSYNYSFIKNENDAMKALGKTVSKTIKSGIKNLALRH